MDIRLALITFITIFLAEIGDKTQLTVFAFSLRNESKISVFIGASAALVLSSLIAVIAAGYVKEFVSPYYMRIIPGILFILIGIWMLLK